MLVVSDSSPLNILIRINLIDLLGKMFGAVVIPTSVAEEMSRPATPQIVKDWITKPPSWLSAKAPVAAIDPIQSRHRGERDAIQLAQELHADAILLDEYKPRVEAQRLGLAVIGTIGILERAADLNLIPDLAAVHMQLRATDFHVASELLDASLKRHQQRNT